MKNRVLLLLITVLCLLSAPAWAKEGGDQYPNGAENWGVGAAPPPGHYYVNYLAYYAGKLKDGAGNDALDGVDTPQANASIEGLRYIEMTHLKIFGGQYGMHVIVPLAYQSAYMGGRASVTNIGDIFINPFILAWHHPQWHALVGVDIYLPTGYYDKNDSRVSLGSNYYGFDPLVAFSYLPHSGWEASTKFMYNLKTTNGATNYRSGQDFHADYAAGKHFGKSLLGVTGYALKQTTDDAVNGQVVAASAGLWDAGRRGQVFAIGPSLGYVNKRGVSFTAQWQHETLVRNRFSGDKIWFKAVMPVSALSLRRVAQ